MTQSLFRQNSLIKQETEKTSLLVKPPFAARIYVLIWVICAVLFCVVLSYLC